MRRRKFIAIVAGTAAWPFGAGAQQSARMRRVGILMNTGATDSLAQSYMTAFAQGLSQSGWIEGKSIRTDVRWNAGDAALARTYAAQLIGVEPDVILSVSTTNLMLLRQATNTIPIVFIQVSDPVAQGFVPNLTRPGGNITGFSAFDFSIGGKWVDLLKQVAPDLARVAVIFNPDSAPQTQYFLRSIDSAAQALNMQTIAMPVRALDDVEVALKNFTQQPNGGVVFPTGGFYTMNQKPLIEMVSRHRLPAVSSHPEFTKNGGLLYYGWEGETTDQFRYAASYVDRILKGAKPGDLPIQRATKFVLTVNMKTAKALGITVPLSLLGLADQVIE
jgi:putative ABC transport system substrate-binding protein